MKTENRQNPAFLGKALSLLLVLVLAVGMPFMSFAAPLAITSPTGTLTAAEVGVLYTGVTATTGSSHTPGNTITWSLESAPGWLSIDSGTGEFSGTPTASAAATSFTLKATDNESYEATQTLSIKVNRGTATFADAVSDTGSNTTTSRIKLTFSEDVAGLTDSNITFTGMGVATASSVTGGGTTWYIPLTAVGTTGTVSVQIQGNVTNYTITNKTISNIDVYLVPGSNPPPSSNTSSGSSGGGGGSSTPAPDPTKVTSDNVSANGSVNPSSAVSDLNNALKEVGAGAEAAVKVKNAQSISAAALKALADAAKKAGKEAVVMADTVGATGAIQARLYVEPDKLTGLKNDLKLRVTTEGYAPAKTKGFFERYFKNNVAVVSCEQQGRFGAKLKIAAKVELPKDTSALKFYSYDKATNSYHPIQTAYTIDKNGYIHFFTELAGDIIISAGPLAKK